MLYNVNVNVNLHACLQLPTCQTSGGYPAVPMLTNTIMSIAMHVPIGAYSPAVDIPCQAVAQRVWNLTPKALWMSGTAA